MTNPIRLTAEEFEALLYEVYQHGFELGANKEHYNFPKAPYDSQLKERFDKLMFDLKLKTTNHEGE